MMNNIISKTAPGGPRAFRRFAGAGKFAAAVTAAVLVMTSVPFSVYAANATIGTGQATVSGTSATITVNATPSSSRFYVYYLGVQISTTNGGQYNSGNMSNSSTVKMDYNKNSTTVTFDNLIPNTTYYYAGFASCNDNYGAAYPLEFDYGGVRSFTTGVDSSGSSYLTVPTVANLQTANTVQASSSYNMGNNVGVDIRLLDAGFVYSQTQPNPTRGASDCTIVAASPAINASKAADSFTAMIQNFNTNFIYYVRSYIHVQFYGTNQDKYFYSATYIYNGGSQNSTGNLAVTTVSAYYTGGNIYAQGAVTGSGYDANTQCGFAYSYTNTLPTTADGYIIASGSPSAFSANITNISTGYNNYYVRAFATNASGTSYGQTQYVSLNGTSNGNLPAVITGNITNITASSADVSFTLSSSGSSPITECGVVYSSTNQNPQLYGSGVSYQTFSAGGYNNVSPGTYTVTLGSLSPSTNYYICAYARNSQGTGYGVVKQLMPSVNTALASSAVSGVTQTTATVSGNVTSDNGYTIQELGVVYSTTNNPPTLSDSKVSAQSAGLGSFSVQLTNLTPGAVYYARTFIRTAGGVSYGTLLNFTTPMGSSPYVFITYRDVNDNSVVSTQQVDVTGVTVLNSSNIQLPYGYKLYDANWAYNIASGTSATVWVTPGTSAPAAPAEGPYMEGSGKYFYPNRAITRGEVVQMIYDLMGGTVTQTSASFSDVPVTNQYFVAAEYAYTMGYMHGYPDGTFRAAKTITRAEFAVVLCNVFKLTGGAGASNFSDVTKSYDWARPSIDSAVASGIINGYPGNYYRPAATTSRGEACKMFSIAADRSSAPLGTAQFADVPENYFAYQYIMNAAIPQG